MTETITIPLWDGQGTMRPAIIDRGLWDKGDARASLCRQVERDQANGLDVPSWVMRYVERHGAEP